ncbi:hypothetical protein BWP33_05685 [Simonsiella muelleri ATCC 29453]|nr:hypothetical protein BWP33_05685 [Simonsiella muelleri ATCC 29453]
MGIFHCTCDFLLGGGFGFVDDIVAEYWQIHIQNRLFNAGNDLVSVFIMCGSGIACLVAGSHINHNFVVGGSGSQNTGFNI